MAISKNSVPKTNSTDDELIQILLNSYVKYEALKEVLINKGITNQEELNEFFSTQFVKDMVTVQAKDYAKTLGVEITQSETVETAQTVLQMLRKK